jgi:uncharacterized protein (TIGR03083 family)
VVAGLRAELDRFWSRVADPEHWNSPTACEGWEARDLAGHLVDAGRSFLDGLDAAARGDTVSTVPPEQVAQAYDEAARSFRSTPRDEVLDQLRSGAEQLTQRLDELTPEQWAGLLVTDRYAGTVPAAALAAGLLAGYAVHGWDLAQGRGATHPVDGDVAELLVPFLFVLWAFTADTSGVDDGFQLGLRVSGRTGGDHVVAVTSGGVTVSAGSVDECPTVLEVDPGTLVLLTYRRVDAGTVHGDRAVLDAFWSVFPTP